VLIPKTNRGRENEGEREREGQRKGQREGVSMPITVNVYTQQTHVYLVLATQMQ